ncbi:hypothetical protein D7Y57_03565 [Stenotrophomonas maltophilia]|nr:hypothetical protein [Stenotrophomonas maltophilia]MBA0267275.1 hypothetical protein [Stenotrophomonas maltophilia]MBA0455219.1 hypothetical protein [Stenotrophomonas maltophilia]
MPIFIDHARIVAHQQHLGNGLWVCHSMHMMGFKDIGMIRHKSQFKWQKQPQIIGRLISSSPVF